MSQEDQPKRKPLLNGDELYDKYLGDCPGNVGGGVIDEIIDFYEGKITSGELLTKAEHDRLVLQAILDHESNQQGTW